VISILFLGQLAKLSAICSLLAVVALSLLYISNGIGWCFSFVTFFAWIFMQVHCYSRRWAKFVPKLYQPRSGRYISPRTNLPVACISLSCWPYARFNCMCSYDFYMIVAYFKTIIFPSFVQFYDLCWGKSILLNLCNGEIHYFIDQVALLKKHIYVEVSFLFVSRISRTCRSNILKTYKLIFEPYASLFELTIVPCRLPV